MSNVDPNAQSEVPQPGVEGQTAESQPVATEQTVNPENSGGKSTEEVAREVLAGQWGRGHRRAERLQLAGYDKAAVQHELNKLLGTEEFKGVQNEGVDNTQDTRDNS